MIAAPDLLQVHMSRHNTGEQMLVSGARRPWPPACQSAFSRITVLSGPRDHLGDGRPTIFEVLSSNLSIRRDLFLQLGGFDESLWAYEDLADRAKRRAAMQADPEWQAFLAKAAQMLVTMENKILSPAPFMGKPG